MLKRRTRLKTRKPIKRANPERRAQKYQRNFDGGIGHDTWIRSLPCMFCVRSGAKQRTKTEACHAKARGMGGAHGDWRYLFPACRLHHREQEANGNKHMERKYGFDPIRVEAFHMAYRHSLLANFKLDDPDDPPLGGFTSVF